MTKLCFLHTLYSIILVNVIFQTRHLLFPFNFLVMLIQVLPVAMRVSLFFAVERQLQQTSLKEWVSRKKSSGSTGTPDVSLAYTKLL